MANSFGDVEMRLKAMAGAHDTQHNTTQYDHQHTFRPRFKRHSDFMLKQGGRLMVCLGRMLVMTGMRLGRQKPPRMAQDTRSSTPTKKDHPSKPRRSAQSDASVSFKTYALLLPEWSTVLQLKPALTLPSGQSARQTGRPLAMQRQP